MPMYRYVPLCSVDCRFVAIMNLPCIFDPNFKDFTLNSLPKTTIRVLVSACQTCYHVQPIDGMVYDSIFLALEN